MIPSLRSVLAAAAALSSAVSAMPYLQSSAPAVDQAAVAQLAPRGQACNNAPELCNRSYSKMTHMGAHDSSFLRDASTGNSVAGNQFFNATVALDAGLRLLQLQVHDKNGVVEMCHTTCDLLDAGPLEQFLVAVKAWMDANPNEVVTLLIVNSDNKPAATFGDLFDKAGLAKMGYVPAGVTAEWPTLGKMIADGKRLVTFLASVEPSAAHPYLLSEFTYVFETAYEVTSLAGFNCTIDRPSTYSTASAALTAGLLPLVNHFAYDSIGSGIMFPNVDQIDTTNSPDTSVRGALGTHAAACRQQWNLQPVFVLVDFWNKGPAIKTADVLNGVSSPVGRKAVPSVATTSAAAEGGPRGRGAGFFGLFAFVVAALVLV